MFGREKIEYKTPEQVRVMRRAGLVVADIHAALRAAVAPGMTTGDLDAVSAEVIERAGARSNFLGYQGFPATACISVNEEIVHGIPGERVIQDGDVVSFDCGAVVDGWHGDAAFSMVVGQAAAEDLALVETTEAAMWAGIAALATGSRLGDVGAAVEDAVERANAERGLRLGVVEEYVGHGIGTAMHQPPEVLNYRTREKGPRLRPGMCLCVEPMITAGSSENTVLEDEWTVVTLDGSRAAHFEHTVALLDGGIWVLTAPDGGAAALAAHGVEVAPLT
ncbi:type I methionyl aminopeptidase [Georgenia thermotolerans]|uniref:Methionine aminopeptidase n=1 Tax=Georgenia thermotolerans TaxID=527326 RepID=A0A7J5UIJ7_9MICO|nr:type I methionyl aminopeptidase [Georgenia thermotolerans]KAE8762205.1 type I methionyl aminopeptidase [Georgenia thermotolerans]